MLNGDLSNHMSTTFGVRCDGFLVEYRTQTVKDKIVNALVGKVKHSVLNERALSLMNFIFRETEYTVDLVVKDSEYTNEMRNLIDDLPFNRVVTIRAESDITARLLTGDLSYYVDGDMDRLSLVQNPHSLPPEAAFEMVRSARVGRGDL